MPKIRSRRAAKTSESQQHVVKELRDLQVEIKAIKKALAAAVRTEAQLRKLRERIISELKGFKNDLKGFETRLSEVERNFEERVKVVADNVLANLKDAWTGEKDSGTRRSPFGKVADEGLAGPVLPGSFESSGG
jgi:predicted  nucleic acid-binding Zn-ribbon protein